jgi:hypothetical protein
VKEPVVIKALILPKKHEGEPYVLLEPEEGASVLTTVLVEGPECPLTKENKITGSIVALVANNDTVAPKLVFSRAIQELFQVGAAGDHLKFGAFESYIDAEKEVKLTDASHVGKTIGVC